MRIWEPWLICHKSQFKWSSKFYSSLSDIPEPYFIHPTFLSLGKIMNATWESNLFNVWWSTPLILNSPPLGSSSDAGLNPKVASFYLSKPIVNFGKAVAISFSISAGNDLMHSARKSRRHRSGFVFSNMSSDKKFTTLFFIRCLLGEICVRCS